jgi:hypothetical protein
LLLLLLLLLLWLLLLLLLAFLPALLLLLSVLPPSLLLLLSVLSPLLLILPLLALGVVLRRRRGLGEDDGGLPAVIGPGLCKIIGGMGRSQAGKARQNGTCHQQTPEFFHLISYGCGVGPEPERRAVESKRAKAGVGSFLFCAWAQHCSLILYSGGLLTLLWPPA